MDADRDQRPQSILPEQVQSKFIDTAMTGDSGIKSTIKGTDNLATLGTVNKNATAYQLPIDESSGDEETKK